jgi:hypothetical protein
MRPHPSGDWVFNFQMSIHEHNRPGRVFQSFCWEGQPDRRCRAPFSYIGPVRSFRGHAKHQLLLGGRLELRLLLSSSIVTLVGRSCTFTITHLSSASTLPPPRTFAIFSLHRSKSSVVVPVLEVNAIPVRTEETVYTSFPLGKALFTVLMMKSGCTDHRAE